MLTGGRQRHDRLADFQAGRAAAAGPQDELCRQQLHGRGKVRDGDAIEEASARPLTEHANGLEDGRERGVEQARRVDIVEADHGHLAWYPHAGRREGPQHPDRHLVVGAHDRIGQRATVPGEQVFTGLFAASRAEDAVLGADKLALRIVAQHVMEAEPPLDGVGCIQRAVHMEQSLCAVIGNQVGDDRRRSGEVVGRHDVGRPVAWRPGYDHHGDPRGQALDMTGADEPFADEDAVHLARTSGSPIPSDCMKVISSDQLWERTCSSTPRSTWS